MKLDNSLNKPDPMAEDSYQILVGLVDDVRMAERRYQDIDPIINAAEAAINAYTTNKIIEELEAAGVPDYFYWNKDGRNITVGERIAELKALNHRKENK